MSERSTASSRTSSSGRTRSRGDTSSGSSGEGSNGTRRRRSGQSTGRSRSSRSRRRERGRAGFRAQAKVAGVVIAFALCAVTIFVAATIDHRPASDLAPSVTSTPEADSAADADPALTAIRDELASALSQTTWPALVPAVSDVIAGYTPDPQISVCGNPVHPSVADCTWGEPGAPLSVALVGDATSMGYVPAFRALAEQSEGQLKATALGVYGCPFADLDVDPGDGTDCVTRTAEVVQELAALKPDVLVVTNSYLTPKVTPDRLVTVAEYSQGIARQLEKVADDAGKIVLLAPSPADKELQACYDPEQGPRACVSRVTEQWSEIAATERRVAATVGGVWVDSRPLFCLSTGCPAFAAGMPTRFDRVHITDEYSVHVAPGVAALFARAGVSLTTG